jgi:hypothetical protein
MGLSRPLCKTNKKGSLWSVSDRAKEAPQTAPQAAATSAPGAPGQQELVYTPERMEGVEDKHIAATVRFKDALPGWPHAMNAVCCVAAKGCLTNNMDKAVKAQLGVSRDCGQMSWVYPAKSVASLPDNAKLMLAQRSSRHCLLVFGGFLFFGHRCVTTHARATAYSRAEVPCTGRQHSCMHRARLP